MNPITTYLTSKEVNTYLDRGRELLEAGKFAAAKNLYLEALDLMPNSAAIYQKLGQSCLELEQWQEAITYYTEVLQIKTEDYWTYCNLGKALKAQNKLEEAINYYQKAIMLQPSQAIAYRKLGAVFLERKQWTEAIISLENAIALENDYAWNYYELGRIFLQAKDYKQAVSNYQKFITLEPDFWEGYFRLGKAYQQLNQYRESSSAYARSIDLNPDFSWHYFYSGNISQELQKYSEAVNNYRHFTTLEPNFWQGYQHLGESFLGLNKLQEAASSFQKAISLNKTCFASYYNWGVCLFQLEQKDSAIRVWNQGLNLKPKDARSYVKIIDFLIRLQAIKEAQTFIDLGLNNCHDNLALFRDCQKNIESKSDPLNSEKIIVTDFSQFFNLGKKLAQKGKWQPALEAMQSALQLNPDDPWLNCEIGLCFTNLGRHDSAERAFAIAVEQQPNHSWLHTCLADAFFEQKKWQNAANNYLKAVELKSNNFWRYDRLARCLSQLEKHQEAIDSYQKAIELKPEKASLHYELGQSWQKQQQLDEAQKAFENAISINPLEQSFHESYLQLLILKKVNRQQIDVATTKKSLYEIVTTNYATIAANQDDYLTHRNLADALLNLQQWSEAMAAYDYSLQLNPQQPTIYANLGQALFEQGKWQRAEEAYNLALENNSAEFWLYQKLAETLSKLGKYEAAIANYELAISKKQDPWLYQALGRVFEQQYQWQKAAEAYYKAIELNSKHPWLWTCLGNVLVKLQKWQDALDAYEHSRQLNDGKFWEQNNLGDCLFHLGQWEKAAEAYQIALTESPNLSWSHKLSDLAWSYHRSGNSLLLKSQWQQAEQAYRQAIKLNGDLPWHYFRLAESLERQYKTVDALTAYRKAAELTGESAWFQENESQAIETQDRNSKSIVICIYTCAKYHEQQEAIRNTWLKKVIDYQIPYYFVIGKPGAKSYVEGDILYVDAPDSYEHLPHKTYKFIEYIHNRTFYNFVFKVDDDCYVDVDSLLECGCEQHDYMGKVTGHAEINRSWHLGKTENPNIGEYQGTLKGTWADGASGYFLNRYAMNKLLQYSDYEEIAAELYEDKMVGDLLRGSGINPTTSSKYKIGVEREDQYTDHQLGFAPWHETSYPHKNNDLVVFHSDAAPEVLHAIHQDYLRDDVKPRQFLRKPRWWEGYPHNTICLEQISDRKIKLKKDDILCFLTVRNEILRLPYILDYYRQQGINWFFIVDNHSTDNTRDYLQAQPDVHFWHTTRAYGESRWGVDWIELLLQNYGVNHWCLLVDADELLYYPDCETKNIHQLCNELDRNNKQALTTVLLDMYSQAPLQEACYTQGQNFLDICQYFDRDYYTLKADRTGPFTNQAGYWGGLRQRIFQNMEQENGNKLYCLNKVPLVKYNHQVKLCEGFHWIDNVDFASQTGCLLHFKYFSTFHERAKEEVARGQHWNGASEYAQYARQLDENPQLSFYNPQLSVKLTGSKQLIELGIIRTNS